MLLSVHAFSTLFKIISKYASLAEGGLYIEDISILLFFAILISNQIGERGAKWDTGEVGRSPDCKM